MDTNLKGEMSPSPRHTGAVAPFVEAVSGSGSALGTGVGSFMGREGWKADNKC